MNKKTVRKSSNNTVVNKVGNNENTDEFRYPFTLPKNFLYQTCHTLGHDLKSPLFVIRSYAQLLQRTQDPEKLDRGLKLVDEASYKLEHIINGFVQLMDIYTIPYVDIDTISFEEIMLTIESQLSPIHERFCKHIVTDFGVQTVKFNKDYLITILFSLVDNALKHNPEKEDLQIKISTVPMRGDRFALVIEDNGKGVDISSQGMKDKLKQPFYRADKNDSGIGIGLAKVNAIARMTNCDFAFDSKVGLGVKCTFIFK